VNESQTVTTPQDVILQKQAEKLRIFGELLTKCIALDLRRNPERRELMNDIRKQFISDASYLVRNTLPPDIMEAIRAKKGGLS
jgi:hypothetical protein